MKQSTLNSLLTSVHAPILWFAFSWSGMSQLTSCIVVSYLNSYRNFIWDLFSLSWFGFHVIHNSITTFIFHFSFQPLEVVNRCSFVWTTRSCLAVLSMFHSPSLAPSARIPPPTLSCYAILHIFTIFMFLAPRLDLKHSFFTIIMISLKNSYQQVTIRMSFPYCYYHHFYS